MPQCSWNGSSSNKSLKASSTAKTKQDTLDEDNGPEYGRSVLRGGGQVLEKVNECASLSSFHATQSGAAKMFLKFSMTSGTAALNNLGDTIDSLLLQSERLFAVTNSIRSDNSKVNEKYPE